MNQAIDITHTRQHWPQFDSSAPDAEAAQQQALDDYVSAWLDGSLYDDGEVYAGPLQALVDDDGEMLGDLLRAYRSKDPQWFDHLAGRVARALEKHVRGQA